MEYRPDPAAKEELLDRRERLVSALSEPRSGAELRRLLEEVDAALERHGAGTYGLCETCREPIEPDLLLLGKSVAVGIKHSAFLGAGEQS